MIDPSLSLDDPRVASILGYPIRLRVRGDGDSVLLINGLTRPLQSWEPLTDALVGFRIIGFDVPGIGGSPTPLLPPSMSVLAQIATAVLDEVGISHAHVIGYSHGGAIAQQMAFQSPERVRSLVLISTSCGVGSTVDVPEALATMATPRDHPWPRAGAIGVLWNSLALASWSSIPFLGSISAPSLIVTGNRDRVVPPSNSAMLARRIPGATLVTLTAGHDLQQPKHAGELASAIDAFLTALSSTAD